MNYKRNSSFVLKEIAGDHILIPRGAATVDFSSVILFNETGVFLWKHMESFRSSEELAALLVETFNAPEDAARQDVEAFLEKMVEDGMVIKEAE